MTKSQDAPKCLSCGKTLRRYRWRNEEWAQPNAGWGDYGDGFFCGLKCGWAWAVAVAKKANEEAK